MQPSSHQLAWYHEWSVKLRRSTDIATAAGVSPQVVSTGVQVVDRWLRSQQIDDVVAQRIRQTEALEEAAAQCLAKWNESFDLKYLEEARKLLSDLRGMWDVGKPAEAADEWEGLVPVDGKTRLQAWRDQAAAMLNTIAAAEAAEADSEFAEPRQQEAG